MNMLRANPLLIVGVAVAACAESGSGDPAAPDYAQVQDLEDLPDLIVDRRTLAASWAVYDQELRESSCSVREGGVAGQHRVLRFTVTTPNEGDTDLHIGSPWSHLADGLFEMDFCHGHFHFRNYALYQLWPAQPADGDQPVQPVRARKQGFCMLDVTPWGAGAAPGPWVYRSCGTLLEIGSGNQGISAGWADTYSKWLDGQYFVLDDPANPVPPGDYLLRITVNPRFVPATGEPCPALEKTLADGTKICHNFAESDYGNNVADVRITIPDRVGRTGFGPGAGEPPPAHEPIDGENAPLDG